jgi:hypothetical protein
LEYFAFFGGFESKLNLDFFDDFDEVILHNVVLNYNDTRELISPSYLMESPYREIMIAIAKGDGKLLNIFRRAKVSEVFGKEIIMQLKELEIIDIEKSRETPLKTHPKQKIKKHLRSYRIQSKVRFKEPFFRFWFGFVEPYHRELKLGKTDRFWTNYHKHYDRCVSLAFEQLSNSLLEIYQNSIDPLVEKGGFWDQHSEFDILATTQSGKTILGECKYKSRKICKSELTKLKEKATLSNITVDTYALFSLSGFSNELLQSSDRDLLLFEAKDFTLLL